MSVIGEVTLAIGLVGAVAQVVSAYRDGGGIFDKIKQKRAARQARPLPRQLEDSVYQTPEDIEREKNRGLTRFGEAFEHGDYIAILTIQQITIQIQTSFLAKLRNAYDDSADFTELLNDADTGRDGTIRALIELQQRLLVASPIPNAPLWCPTQNQPFVHATGTRTDTSQLLPSIPTAGKPPNLLENHQRIDSVTEPVITSPRHHAFNPFHKSKKPSKNEERSPELDQYGFRRVQTIPTHSTTAASNSAPRTGTSITEANTLPSRKSSCSPRPNFEYEPWEDNPAEIWRRDTRRSVKTSAHILSTVPRTAVDPFFPTPVRTSTSRSNSSTISIPHPNPSNNYLGFCKGAWKLQDGDRTAMVESRDFTQSAQSKFKFLRCAECKFEGHFNLEVIWDQVFKFQSGKIRWSFLAKSHVRQKHSVSRELARTCDFTYQCIFCAFLGYQQPAIHGAEAYKNHIHEYHYGAALSNVVLYKAGCINDHVCDDSEDFDINLYPKITELN